MSENYQARLLKLDTGAVSDAMDSLGLKGATYGIRPAWPCPRIAGPAVTVKAIPVGLTPPPQHINIHAITEAAPGSILVIDDGGRTDVACMGDLQSLSAKLGGLSGAVIDGACRDIDAVRDIGFPMFTRGVVCMTARGRIQQEAYNVMVQIGGVQVRPGDWIIADGSGVVVIPQEHTEEVVKASEAIVAREEAMAEAVRSGRTILDVMTNFNYEHMLQEKEASKES